jgi:hypothetical protein
VAYSAVDDFAAVSGGSDRMEKRVSCRTCSGSITHRGIGPNTCWPCSAGWPRVTRPEIHPERHPNYAATLARIAAKNERHQRWLENRPFLVEVQ